MFRNTYDSDNTVFSPQGRLHQVEYALEAVKQGSAAVGLRSNTHVILLALKRSTGELASYQKKLIRIDDHIGIAIAGLTSDARVLSNAMRQQAMNSRMLYARPIPVNRVVNHIAERAQGNTQFYGKRPYGVGFLVGGVDDTGPHLYEFSPSGNCLEYYAMSIGARSQSAKTYLERHYESFAECSLDELIKHGLHALRDTLQQDKELNVDNTSIGIVGPIDGKVGEPDSLLATVETESSDETKPAPAPVFEAQPAPRAQPAVGSSTTASLTGSTSRKVPSHTARANFHVIEGDALRSYLDRMDPKEGPASTGAGDSAAAAAPAEQQLPAGGEPTQTGDDAAAQASTAAAPADDAMQTD